MLKYYGVRLSIYKVYMEIREVITEDTRYIMKDGWYNETGTSR